jgi:alcohol dehydrogenase (cytochrome c)
MTSQRTLLLGAFLGVLALTGTASAQQSTLLDDYTPVTDEDIANPADGDWLMWRRTQSNWGYSPLTQINADNVSSLRLEWAWTLDPGRQEATPLVHDGVMFVMQACNYTQALDATTGDLLWEYRREVVEHPAALACGNRNAVLHDDKLIMGTHDAYLVALDVRTGQVAWEHQSGDWQVGHHYSGGPIIADGKIIAGMSGCYHYNSGGCWISAHDASSGEELWRTYTIPRDGEPGAETWGDVPEESRYGGSAWNAGAYDPELGLVYYGVAVPIPWGAEQRGSGDGNVLYTNSTLALDVETGEIAWYFQHMPNEEWDLDHAFERLIVEAAVTPSADEVDWIAPDLEAGETRKVITGIPGKTGIVWTLDAATGDFLWARDTVEQNVVLGVDAEARTAIINDEVRPRIGEQVQVCPYLLGGRNWQATAYHPETNDIYASLNNTCMLMTHNEVQPTIGAHHGSARSIPLIADSADGNVGSFYAINASTGETMWRFDQRAGFPGSALATGSDLVFVTDDNRRFRAFHAETGEVLWEQILNSRATGYPISYEADGRQFIAIPAGYSLTYSALTPEYRQPGGGNMLYVFSLPQ